MVKYTPSPFPNIDARIDELRELSGVIRDDIKTAKDVIAELREVEANVRDLLDNAVQDVVNSAFVGISQKALEDHAEAIVEVRQASYLRAAKAMEKMAEVLADSDLFAEEFKIQTGKSKEKEYSKEVDLKSAIPDDVTDAVTLMNRVFSHLEEKDV